METGDVLAGSPADALVRPATAADAEAIGAVQARAWRAQYADLIPAQLLAGLTPAALAEPWREAITRPPSPRHRVVVACSGSVVVGFAAIRPSADRDCGPQVGELSGFEVDPAHRRSGHGSRLLSAVAQTLWDTGSTSVVSWLPAADQQRRTFFISAGIVPDGARRSTTLDDGRTITEVRVAASLAED